MIKGQKIISLIPLRGGSKSIPYKNIKPIAGHPLCYFVLKAAARSKYIDEVYVSTEDQKIKKAVEELGLGVKIIDRPMELAGDKSTTESVMLHFAEKVPNFDIINLIQATTPFTSSEDLDIAIEMFAEQKLDSLLTGVLHKKFFWTPFGIPLNYDYKKRPMRQDFEGVVHENGAFYLTKKEILLKDKCRLGGKIGIYVFPEGAVDIDEPADWMEAETALLKKFGKTS